MSFCAREDSVLLMPRSESLGVAALRLQSWIAVALACVSLASLLHLSEDLAHLDLGLRDPPA
jgi:hypothetical protein